MCEDKTKSVNWDPNSAVLIRNNDAQSPALGLFHEFLHAVNPSVSEQKIIDLEAVCAKALGEPARKTAADWQYTFRAPNPVERAPIPPPPWRTQFPPPQYQKLPTLPKKK
jgi:hypothetical protein